MTAEKGNNVIETHLVWEHNLSLKVNAYLDSRGQTTKNQSKNLGVILETDLSFSSHVKAVTKSAYYHLKNIAKIWCFVFSQDLEKLVHVFITSRVDYCTGLLTGLPKKTIRHLQLIQNAAARILTRTRKSERKIWTETRRSLPHRRAFQAWKEEAAIFQWSASRDLQFLEAAIFLSAY